MKSSCMTFMSFLCIFRAIYMPAKFLIISHKVIFHWHCGLYLAHWLYGTTRFGYITQTNVHWRWAYYIDSRYAITGIIYYLLNFTSFLWLTEWQDSSTKVTLSASHVLVVIILSIMVYGYLVTVVWSLAPLSDLSEISVEPIHFSKCRFIVSPHLAYYSKSLNVVIGLAASESKNHMHPSLAALSGIHYFTDLPALRGDIITAMCKYRHMLEKSHLPEVKSRPSNASIVRGCITINSNNPQKSHKSTILLRTRKHTHAHMLII